MGPREDNDNKSHISISAYQSPHLFDVEGTSTLRNLWTKRSGILIVFFATFKAPRVSTLGNKKCDHTFSHVVFLGLGEGDFMSRVTGVLDFNPWSLVWNRKLLHRWI